MSRYFVILAGVFMCQSCATSIGWGQKTDGKASVPPSAVIIDSSTLTVDLDEPADYLYKQQILAKLPIGSKPGEIGIRSTPDLSIAAPEFMVVDSQGHLYIDDAVNHRIEKYNSEGKFLQVVLNYSQDTGVGGMAIDSKGNLFVNAFLPGGAEIWQVSEGRINKKFHSKGNIISLGDGEIWIRDRGKPGQYSSLDGKRLFSNEDSEAPKQWPLGKGRTLILTYREPQTIEISVGDEHKAPRTILVLKSKRTTLWAEPVLATPNQIFFSAGIMGKGRVIELRLKDHTVRSVSFPPGIMVGDLRMELAPDGHIYSFNAAEQGEVGSRKYEFQIFKTVPVRL